MLRLLPLALLCACSSKPTIADGTEVPFTVSFDNHNPDSIVGVAVSTTFDGGTSAQTPLFNHESIAQGATVSHSTTGPLNGTVSLTIQTTTGGQPYSFPPLQLTLIDQNGTFIVDYQVDALGSGAYQVFGSWQP